MKLATIERILQVTPIPNAEKIEYVKVLGFDCIVGKGQFNVGDLCVLIQPDTVLPAEQSWTEIYRKKSNRVKAIRLMKQYWSFGIVESLSILPENTQVVEGQDVSEVIGVIKYEPPIPQNLEAKHAYLPHQLPKTDEERCISEDTLIITEDGEKTIKEICESKYTGKVLSFNINSKEKEFKKILNHNIQQNNNDWYEIELEDGKKIKCTGNHKIFTDKGWVETKDISLNFDIFTYDM